MGIAHAIEEGELPASYSPEAAKVAKTMKPGDLEDLASEKESGLPERAKPAKPTSRLRPRPRERKPREIKTHVRHIRKF